MTFAVHFTLAPRWLDPAESEGSITPFLVLYAVQDAMLKPMPSGPTTPSLAESWSVSADGLVYDFLLHPRGGTAGGRAGPRTDSLLPVLCPYEDLRLKP
jgi:ABC-type oligopeptide transport system substrate-binding subunit